MNNTPTPETDAAKWTAARYSTNDYVDVVDASFAAKLERERDEARTITGFALDKDYYEKYQKFCAELEIAKTERDQLRKVCDELLLTSEMLMTVVCNSSGGDWGKETVDWQNAARRYVDEYYRRLTTYNSLPHVIAAKKGNAV